MYVVCVYIFATNNNHENDITSLYFSTHMSKNQNVIQISLGGNKLIDYIYFFYKIKSRGTSISGEIE